MSRRNCLGCWRLFAQKTMLQMKSFRPTMEFIAAAILLPNLIPIVAVLSGIGTPVRTSAIIGYGVVALLARCFRPIVALVVLLAVVSYDVINSIAMLFNLSFLEIWTALRFATDVHLFASPLYILFTHLVVGSTAAIAMITVRRQAQLKSARLSIVIPLLFIVAGFDLWFNSSPHYLFGTAYAQSKPFCSAMIESDFEKRAEASNINLLIVMVEDLGRLTDERLQSLVMAPLHEQMLSDRYELRLGSTEYYGSTTNAETRELCASRQPYTVLTADGSGIDCLPARLARRGYLTQAFHAYTGKMFDRKLWYPRVGFQLMTFREQLLLKMTHSCGGVFQGACDVDVAVDVAQALRAPGPPRLVYWLTLNTHIPVRPGEGMPRYKCDTAANVFADTDVCWMAEMWTDVLERLAEIARDPSLPPTGILIVGDHEPPLWSRKGRSMFRPGEVSWASLWPRTVESSDSTK